MEQNQKKKEPSAIGNLLLEIDELKKQAKEEASKNFFYDTRSSEIDKLVKALAEFTANMPKLTTDKSAMGRYKYQGFPAMLDAINPILSKFGVKATQHLHSIGDTYYIVTMVCHENQYFRSVTALPREYMMAGKTVRTDQNLQAMGGAQTYIKRYALKSMLGIDADDDTDGGATFNRSSYTN